MASVRFSSIVLSYFTTAAVMWGAGVLDPSASLGVVDIFFDIDSSGAVSTSSQPSGLLNQVGSTVGDVAGGLVGPVLAVWTVIRELISVLFWPVATMIQINAPPELVVLFGGVPTAAFFMGVVRTVRESA
jgi:hypothetical protein